MVRGRGFVFHQCNGSNVIVLVVIAARFVTLMSVHVRNAPNAVTRLPSAKTFSAKIEVYVPRRHFRYLPRSSTAPPWRRLLQLTVASLNDVYDTDNFWDFRERVATPDGDWFHADHKITRASTTTARTRPRRQGTGDQFCTTRHERGGIELSRLPAYHLGFTGDLKLYLEQMVLVRDSNNNGVGQTPPPVVYLAGFSLGANVANVVLKLLGELGAGAACDYVQRGGELPSCAPWPHRASTSLSTRKTC